MSKQSLLFKILVPALIICAIGTMWFIKNQDSTQAEEDTAYPLSMTEAVDFGSLAGLGMPSIIDYGSDSCGPCQQMAPALKKIHSEMQGRANIKYIDVWAHPDAANNVPVQVIPTQVFVNSDGTPFVPSEALAKEIRFDMYSHRDTNEHVFTVHQGGLTEEQMRKILNEMGVE